MMPSKLDAAAALESMDSMDALQSKPLTMIPDEIRPAFDYSGLDAQTVDDLHFAEKEYQHGKKLAERGLVHMGNAIAAAHDALCGAVVQQLDNGDSRACPTVGRAHNNQHSEDNFRAWCSSIGVSKSSAYRLLSVSEKFGNIQLDGKSILDVQPATLLYAVAKPSAPAELVAQVKSGDITTHKQYQEALAQIKAEKDRANAAEAERDKLLGAQNRAAWAESHIQDVEAQRDAALADVQGLTEQNARLNAEKEQAEARAHKAEDALKKQPITGVVDKDEVKRQAEALSRNAVQEARQQAAEAQARLRQYQEDAEGLLAPAQACAQQAQFIADSVRAMYLNWFGSAVAADASLAQMGTPLYAVCGEIMSSLEEENTINPTAAGSEEDAEREALFE